MSHEPRPFRILPRKADARSARSPTSPRSSGGSDEPISTMAGDRSTAEDASMDVQATPRANALVHGMKQLARRLRRSGPARASPAHDGPEGPRETEPVTEIPPLEADHDEEVSLSTIHEDRAYARIIYDSEANSYFYEAIEPRLSQGEREILAFLRDTLVRTMDGRKSAAAHDSESYLLEAAREAILDHDLDVDARTRKRIEYYLVRDFLGYGPIDVLMNDPMIEDISCDGPHVPIYIFHRKFESVKTNIAFHDDYELDLFVIRLAQRSGKQISIADPLLDATLPDKSRLQASLSKEITTRGSSFTIRKFRTAPLTPPDLVTLGTMDAAMAAFFWFAMEEGNSLIFAGGTASGKTTTLNAVSLFIPPQKKVVSIEDTREINLVHENWVPGLTRSGFGGEVVGGKYAGSIDMYRLLEAALRQRPEYLLVGEVRGAEALTLFQAMATGHAAYSTMHADSVPSAVYRLENHPINVPRIMIQTVDAIAIQALVRVNNQLVRRIKEVVEIVGIDPQTGDLLTNTVFRWDAATDTYSYRGKSRILETIIEKKNLGADAIEAEWARRTRVIEWMVKQDVNDFQKVAELVGAYYHTPEKVLAKMTPPANTGGLRRAHE